MRLINLICLSVILVVFSSIVSMTLSNIGQLDRELQTIKRKTDSLIFISESFRSSCQGKGFSSLEEWKLVCGNIWHLKNIEWKKICLEEGELYYAKWVGPDGAGQIYVKKENENESGFKYP